MLLIELNWTFREFLLHCRPMERTFLCCCELTLDENGSCHSYLSVAAIRNNICSTIPRLLAILWCMENP